MSKSRFQFSMSWYSSLPTFGQALEKIIPKMEPGKFLDDLGRARLTFGGRTNYGPHTTITFETETLAQGFRFADLINATLTSEFTAFPGIDVRVGGRTRDEVIRRLEEAMFTCALDLKETRMLFRNSAIAKIRKDLEEAHAAAGNVKTS